MSGGEANGSAFLIDPATLGPEGWKLLGGIEALNAAAMTVKRIRERSPNVQERVFLAEMGDLLKSFAEAHKGQLAALAMQNGAGELQQAPKAALN